MSSDRTDTVAKTGIMVKVGKSRFTIPVVTVILAILSALGTAYNVVSNERKEAWDAIASLRATDQALERKVEMEQVMLSDIRTQLARIDARVAEVQVTLMRRP